VSPANDQPVDIGDVLILEEVDPRHPEPRLERSRTFIGICSRTNGAGHPPDFIEWIRPSVMEEGDEHLAMPRLHRVLVSAGNLWVHRKIDSLPEPDETCRYRGRSRPSSITISSDRRRTTNISTYGTVPSRTNREWLISAQAKLKAVLEVAVGTAPIVG
jgi:hypothetical protein